MQPETKQKKKADLGAIAFVKVQKLEKRFNDYESFWQEKFEKQLRIRFDELVAEVKSLPPKT